MIRSVARVVAFAGLLAACSAASAAVNTNKNVVNADFNNLDNLDADLVDLLHANDGMKRRMQEDDAPTPSPSAEAAFESTMAPTMTATEGARGIDDVETAAPTAADDVDRGIEIGNSEAPTPAPTPEVTSAASATATVPIVLSMAAAVAAAAVVAM